MCESVKHRLGINIEGEYFLEEIVVGGKARSVTLSKNLNEALLLNKRVAAATKAYNNCKPRSWGRRYWKKVIAELVENSGAKQ